MDEDNHWNIRTACGLASISCLYVASVVSGLYHCVDDWDANYCMVSRYAVVIYVMVSWIICFSILGVLYELRCCLRKRARRNDNKGRKLRAFFYRLGIEFLYMVAGIVMPVASVKVLDMVPEHNNVMSCAFVMSSVILLSFAFLEYDDFGLHDTIESIFLSVQNLTIIEHHTKKHHPHHIRNMFITAGICSLGRLTVFLNKEYMRWNQSDGDEVDEDIEQGHARILDRLEARMEVVGIGDAETINMLETLRAELQTLRTQSF